MPYPCPRATLTLGALLLSAVVTASAYSPKSAPELTIYGDLRARYEWDWDSHTSTGALRADRDRARVRARTGFTYKLGDGWSLGARLRTGDRRSQQSPHLTIHSSDDVTDDFAVQADKYFVQYKEGAFTAWGGRNGSPFWHPDEMFLDEDVTPTGVAGSYDSKVGAGTLTTTGAALFLPDGAIDVHGTLLGGQLKYAAPLKPGSFTLATGLYQFNGRNGAKYLSNRNGARDYLIGVVAAQLVIPITEKLPLTFSGDVMNNFKDYSAADVAPFAASHVDDTTGFIVSVGLGQLKKANDWQIGYSYTNMETFAVNASYSQDDWARFGSGPQSAVTDIKGSELRAGYAFTSTLNVQLRAFWVDAITSVQDGKRLRVDLNWKF
jgi:hypothetical protein